MKRNLNKPFDHNKTLKTRHARFFRGRPRFRLTGIGVSLGGLSSMAFCADKPDSLLLHLSTDAANLPMQFLTDFRGGVEGVVVVGSSRSGEPGFKSTGFTSIVNFSEGSR